MSGNWDANVRLLYPAEKGQRVALESILVGDAFDVVTHVEIGKGIMQFATGWKLFVSVRNVSRCTVLATETTEGTLPPANEHWHRQIPLAIDAGWVADEGDMLDIIATFRFRAGANEDYSFARSEPFVVAVS